MVAPGFASVVALAAAIFATVPAKVEEPPSYGSIIDPWLKEYTQALRLTKDDMMLARLHRGEVSAFTQDGNEVNLDDGQRRQLLAAFPEGADQPHVADAVWNEKTKHFSASARRDPACPVNTENHLEVAAVQVLQALTMPLRGAAVNVGGLYGGRDGAEPDKADDPTVELLRAAPATRVLCYNCEGASRVTRLGADGAVKLEHHEVNLLSAEVPLPAAFHDLDWLRLDFVPGGQSCQLLRNLLRSGARPRLVIMMVLSQVPPPFRFVPLVSGEGHPKPLISCSLSAAAAELAPYGLSLLRLTGPYALFVERSAWPEPLPISDLDCYREASVWGYEDLPLPFVREWIFTPVAEALPRIWSNLTDLYAATGHPGAPLSFGL